MTRKSGKNVRHTEPCSAVSTLLCLISSAHRNLHHWRSNQQSQQAKAETLPLGHRLMSRISNAELTSHGENARQLDLTCLEGTYSLQRTRPPSGLRLPKSELWILTTLSHGQEINIYIYIYICVCVCVWTHTLIYWLVGWLVGYFVLQRVNPSWVF